MPGQMNPMGMGMNPNINAQSNRGGPGGPKHYKNSGIQFF